MLPPDSAPQTETELLQRVSAIAGFTLGELADMADIVVPKDFKKHKGWSGQLLERWLGATAGSKPQQDFVHLGIELKSLPITSAGKSIRNNLRVLCPPHRYSGANLAYQQCEE